MFAAEPFESRRIAAQLVHRRRQPPVCRRYGSCRCTLPGGTEKMTSTADWIWNCKSSPGTCGTWAIVVQYVLATIQVIKSNLSAEIFYKIFQNQTTKFLHKLIILIYKQLLNDIKNVVSELVTGVDTMNDCIHDRQENIICIEINMWSMLKIAEEVRTSQFVQWIWSY